MFEGMGFKVDHSSPIYKQVIERERMEELVGIGMGRSEGGWE